MGYRPEKKAMSGGLLLDVAFSFWGEAT